MAGGAHLVTTTSLICASGAVCQARVLEGAELLAVSTHLADVLFVAVGTILYAACYTCCSGGVGLLVIVAGRALERSISLRAHFAIDYAISLISARYTSVTIDIVLLCEFSTVRSTVIYTRSIGLEILTIPAFRAGDERSGGSACRGE